MKTNSPSHEEVTQRAQEIWKSRGCPEGCDTEIWLEAERKLMDSSGEKSPSNGTSRSEGGFRGSVAAGDSRVADSTSGHTFENSGSHPTPGETAAKVIQQKKEARGPKVSVKAAPKPAPTESGKPLWDKPHSS